MQIVYMNGRRLQLTWREVQLQFRHPLFVGMLLVMGSCIVVIGPYDPLLNFGALRLTIFYAACFSSFSALLYLAMYACHRFDLTAYSVFTAGFAGLGATVVGLIAALLLGAPMPSAKDMTLVTGFNLVFCYLGETLQSTYIIPRILADLRGRAPRNALAEFIAAEAEAGPATIPPLAAEPVRDEPVETLAPLVTIFGQSFATHAINLIEAEEHYVTLTLSDGTTHLLRGRIADAVAVMPADLGRQVHRSYWVAARAVVALRNDQTRSWLVLSTGETVPVARSRRVEVRAWVEAVCDLREVQKAPQRVPFETV